MDIHKQQTGPSQPPANRYDRVMLREAGGKTRQLSRKEFESLPLRERVSHLIGGTAEFFAGTVRLTPAEAMKG